MPSASYGSVPFPEQQAFFQRKLNIPTRHWTDIYSAEHDWAFMVAGANRDEIVSDFRQSIEHMIDEGLTLDDFRKDFDSIVAEHGWDYNGGRNWRSEVIYGTNLRSSYAAGRLAQLEEARETLPYWQYHHSGSENPRHQHLLWDGMVLRADDPFWRRYYPPNGWGCGCYVTALSEQDLIDMNLTVSPSPVIEYEERVIGKRSPNGPRIVRVPKGVDPGFEHAPGRSRLDSAVLPELPDPPVSGSSGMPGVPNRRPPNELPPPRPVSQNQVLPGNLSEQEYAEAFLAEFGATLDVPALFRDVVGESLVVGRELFVNRRTGRLKSNKNERGKYMSLLAQTVKEPDEIWVRIEHIGARNEQVVRRRYIARFDLPDSDIPALAVFERGKDGWSGITTFVDEASSLDDMRIGVRLYRRSEE